MQILSSIDAHRYLRRIFRNDIEQFWIVCLSANNGLIHTEKLFQGTVDSCPVHPRDVFRVACTQNSSAIIVAHNHPSGDPQPSMDDIQITRSLANASRLMQIRLLDHIVLGTQHYYSFADNNFIIKRTR